MSYPRYIRPLGLLGIARVVEQTRRGFFQLLFTLAISFALFCVALAPWFGEVSATWRLSWMIVIAITSLLMIAFGREAGTKVVKTVGAQAARNSLLFPVALFFLSLAALLFIWDVASRSS